MSERLSLISSNATPAASSVTECPALSVAWVGAGQKREQLAPAHRGFTDLEVWANLSPQSRMMIDADKRRAAQRDETAKREAKERAELERKAKRAHLSVIP